MRATETCSGALHRCATMQQRLIAHLCNLNTKINSAATSAAQCVQLSLSSAVICTGSALRSATSQSSRQASRIAQTRSIIAQANSIQNCLRRPVSTTSLQQDEASTRDSTINSTGQRNAAAPDAQESKHTQAENQTSNNRFVHQNKHRSAHKSSADLKPVSDLSSLPFGLVALWKPVGFTSAQAVSIIKRRLEKGDFDPRAPSATSKSERQRAEAAAARPMKTSVPRQKHKVGHGGTLDQAASGILVLGVNSATKLLAGLLTNCRKRYRATLKLGEETETGDASSPISARAAYDHITPHQLEEAMSRFRGDFILQTPPVFSAIKQSGKRCSDLARSGQTVVMTPRMQSIWHLELVQDFKQGDQDVRFEVECSSGTYVRSLCRDLGVALNSRAHMLTLARTRQWKFEQNDCITLESTREAIINTLAANQHLTIEADTLKAAAAQTQTN